MPRPERQLPAVVLFHRVYQLPASCHTSQHSFTFAVLTVRVLLVNLQALFDLEATNTELKADLRDMYITSASEIDVSSGRKAIIIHVRSLPARYLYRQDDIQNSVSVLLRQAPCMQAEHADWGDTSKMVTKEKTQHTRAVANQVRHNLELQSSCLV